MKSIFTPGLLIILALVALPANAKQIAYQADHMNRVGDENTHVFYEKHHPDTYQMAADALIARPLGILATVGGAATFVVSLPFSRLGGTVHEARVALVDAPMATTFKRPLGAVKATMMDEFYQDEFAS